MIPKPALDLLELHMQQARESEREEFAEKMLYGAECMLGCLLTCSHIDAVEYGNRLVLINLIRAQRRTSACAA